MILGFTTNAMEKLAPSQQLQLKYDKETLIKSYFQPNDIVYFRKKFTEIKKRREECVQFALTPYKLKSGLATFDLLNGIVSIYKTSLGGVPIKGESVLRVTLDAFELMITDREGH